MPNGFSDADFDTPVNYSGIALPSRGGPSAQPQAQHVGGDGYNIPSKPQPKADGVGNTQASRRFTDTFFDQHKSRRFPNGRPWTGERELAANPDRHHEPGFVTSDLQQGEYIANEQGIVDRVATFGSVWQAPWIPLPKYFRFHYKQKRITFDYQRGLTDEQQAYNKYYEAAALLGAGLNVRVEYGKVPSFQITAKLGFPTKLIPIYRAAMAEDPWLLGFRDEPNVELAKLLGISEHGLRVYSYEPEPKGLVTPEQVVATEPSEMKALIAKLEAMQAEIASLRAAAKPKRSHHKQKEQKPVTPSQAGTNAA